MKTILRQQLLDILAELPSILDLYAARDPDFLSRSLDWMSEAEEMLLRFQSPSASLLAVQRGLIMAASDGYRHPDVEERGRSKRKAVRATASLCLARAEQALHEDVEAITSELEPLRLQMAQLLSVASTLEPIPTPPKDTVTDAWLRKVWRNLSINGDTKAMYEYLNAALRPVDRYYLLGELIANMLSQGSPKTKKDR